MSGTTEGSRRWRRRSARARHIARRTREAPLEYVAWKVYDLLDRRIWMLLYRLNAGTPLGRATNDYARTRPADWVRGMEAEHARFRVVAHSVLEHRATHASALVERADRIVGTREFPVLGYGRLALGDPVRWDADLTSGATWPRSPSFGLTYVRPHEASDVKVPWEVGRMQFLPWLSQAWLLTDDSTYVAHGVALVEDFSRNARVGIGVQWTCPMDVAIRALNLLVFTRMAWPELEPEDRARLCHLLEMHAGFLDRHRERADVNGNHYMVGLAVRLVLSLACDDPRRVARRSGLVDALDREVTTQVHDDGMHIEHSTNYHRLVLEVVELAACSMRAGGVRPSDGFASRLRGMVDVVDLLRRDADGQIPLIGDSDSGQCVILAEHNVNDVRPLIDLGEVLLETRQEPATAFAAWALGEPLGLPPAVGGGRASGTTILQDAGIGVVRSSGAAVVMRAGAAGRRGLGGHDHSDQTAVSVEMLGHEVLTDPGSSSYTRDAQTRRDEVAAHRHNMVLVDSRDPASIAMGSVMAQVGTDVRGWLRDLGSAPDGRLRMSGAHDGYLDVPGLEGYSRVVEVARSGEEVTIRDELAGTGSHTITGRLFLGADVEAASTGTGLVLTLPTGDAITLQVDGWSSVEVSPTYVSPAYGCQVPSSTIELQCLATLPVQLTTTLRRARGAQHVEET